MRGPELKPLFTHSATGLVSLEVLVAAGVVGLLGLGSLSAHPVYVAGVAFCFFVGAALALLALRQWDRVRRASFYDDHIEVVAMGVRMEVGYPGVESLRSFGGWVSLAFSDHGVPAFSFPNSSIRALRTRREAWLASKVPAEALRLGTVSGGVVEAVRDDVRALMGRGARWVLLLLAVQAFASVAIPSIPFLPGEQSHFAILDQQRNAAFAGLSHFGEFWAIFRDNLFEAMKDLLPGAGVLSFLSSTYDTARIVQVDALAAGRLSPSLYTGYYFLFPHTWIELSGYAVAMFQALRIAALWVRTAGRPRFVRFIAAHVFSSVCLVALVILVAAAFEEGEVVMGSFGFLSWIPFGLVLLAVFETRSAL